MPDSDLHELEALARIAEDTRARYSARLREHGDSPKSVGWDCREHQRRRFEVAVACADFAGRSVLDVGCGLGDVYGFLRDCGIGIESYLGVDLNAELIDLAARKYPEARFEVFDVASDPSSQSVAQADIVIMLGLCNFKQTHLDNAVYAPVLMCRAFALAKEALICDFLSQIRTSDYPQEDWVYYYDPRVVLGWALEVSPKVVLRHDYPPLPQRELMVVIRR